MTTHLAAAGLALQILAYRESAVWRPPADFRSKVLTACDNRGAGFSQCFIDQMKAAGASPDALAFTHLVHGDGYIQAFRPVAQVGIASVLYPFRANENDGLYLVNGRPPALNIDDLQKLPSGQMDFDHDFASVKKSHPNADLWPGDRSSADSLLALTFPDGSQQFVADYRVQAGCHACAVLGQAFFSFGFDQPRQFHRRRIQRLYASLCIQQKSHREGLFSKARQYIHARSAVESLYRLFMAAWTFVRFHIGDRRARIRSIE